MTRYFLTRVHVEGFRGINNENEPLDLRFKTQAVNSIFAVNGTGKSSIFEALSYAIRGTVPKLDAVPSAERPNEYYVNRFHSQATATIDLEFESDETTPRIIKIRVVRDAQGARTVTSPSGHPDPEGFLASLNEAFALLDHQDFVSFIEDSPLERGRSFASLLGLAEYSNLRQALRAVADRRAFNTDFELQACETRVSDLSSSLGAALRQLQSAYSRLTGKSIVDVERLDEYVAEVAGALAGIDLLKPHVAGQELKDIDFDAIVDAIKTAERGEDRAELARVLESLQQLDGLDDVPAVGGSLDEMEAQVTELESLLSETRGDECQHMYESASKIIGDDREVTICPLCQTDLKAPVSDLIAEQLAQYRAVTDQLQRLRSSWGSSALRTRLQALERIGLREPDDAHSSERFHSLLETGRFRSKDIALIREFMEKLEERAVERKKAFTDRKEKLESDLPPSLVTLTEQVEAGRQFVNALNDHSRLSSELSKAERRLDVRKRWASFITKAADEFSDAEAAMTAEKVEQIKTEYKEMFSEIMYVQDVVPELKKEQGREELHVELSEFHGLRNQSARALLSESFRNALAISVFLAAAARHTGTPRFIVLDDVTSSFDAGHQLKVMELIRTKLRNGARPDGLQFIILSHDGQLEKYFDRLDATGDWSHQKLQGSPPLGAVMSQSQDSDRLRRTAEKFLDAGQVDQAQPLIRQYLEFRLMQVIRKVEIPVPIDFAMRDSHRVVSNCLDAITTAVDLHDKAGTLVLEPAQKAALSSTHVPALIGNWVSHYETASSANISSSMLKSVLQTIDDFAECFRYDDTTQSPPVRRWYRSLSAR